MPFVNCTNLFFNTNVINSGIANTMDLPEKLLPRISSRMGIQRLCFGPYNFHQLQEIISSRLNGIDVFEKQAVEFASRKVSPWHFEDWIFLVFHKQWTLVFVIYLLVNIQDGVWLFRLQLSQEMHVVLWRYADVQPKLQIIEWRSQFLVLILLLQVF